MKEPITVTIKLFSGLHRNLDISDYDPSKGLVLTIKKGTRLRKVLKEMGLANLSSNAYFRRGERIGLMTKLKDGDVIDCLKPSGGG